MLQKKLKHSKILAKKLFKHTENQRVIHKKSTRINGIYPYNFNQSTSQHLTVSLDFLAKHVFSHTCQGLKTPIDSGKYCAVSNIQQVSVFVLTYQVARLYVFMVGMAYKYNSLTANNVRRLFVHGSLTSRSPIFYQTGVGHGH